MLEGGGLKAEGVGRTHVGRVRTHNEDCFAIDEALGLFVVSDGMGGHAGGEVASKTAVAAVLEHVRSCQADLAAIRGGREPREMLARIAEEAIGLAARRVYDLATSPEGQSGMGCTLTMLLLVDKGGAMAHVGDTRLYQLRNERVSQLSQDHTMLAELLRQGTSHADSLKHSPFAHVLSRAVGPHPAVQVETAVFDAIAGDRYVLCSDGFSHHLPAPETLAPIVAEGLDEGAREAAADRLVAMANDGGGEDNITVLVITVGGDAAQPGRALAVEARYEALRSMFMFEDLDHRMVARVLQVCRMDEHKPGDVVVELGQATDELFVVVAGRYELSDDAGAIGELGPSDFAGVTTLIKARVSRARLRAVEPSRLLCLSSAAFSKLVRRRPWLGIFLLERLGNKISGDLDRSYQQREGSAGMIRVRERF